MQTLKTGELQIELAAEHTQACQELTDVLGRPPHLEMYLSVGPDGVDGPSANYVNKKVEYAQQIGVTVAVHELEVADLEAIIWTNNARPDVDGQMLQLPLQAATKRESMREGRRLSNLIDSLQDVDGLGEKALYSAATPLGIVRFLEYLEDDETNGINLKLEGAVIAINGSESLAVGRPLVPLLKAHDALVIPIDLQHGNTHMLRSAISVSDILVTCTGVPGIIKPEYMHEGLIVIDAGLRVKEGDNGGRLQQLGDLDPKAFELGLRFYANRPTNAIGPLTIRMLASNTIDAAWSKTEPMTATNTLPMMVGK